MKHKKEALLHKKDIELYIKELARKDLTTEERNNFNLLKNFAELRLLFCGK